MKIEKTFEGYFGGDGECFCWNVDWETFQQIDSSSHSELDWRQQDNIEQGHEKNYGLFGEKSWSIYPSQLIQDLDRKKKYKITLIVEEIK
jgi:hypothetical protein